MGKKVNVGSFCEKELAADPYYLRGYLDKDSSEAVCVSGKKVLFKYLCVKISDKALCSQEAKSSCEFIQSKLAKRLDMVHASFVKNEKGIKQLNCFFESLPLSEKKSLLGE
jgi:pyruvate kinase